MAKPPPRRPSQNARTHGCTARSLSQELQGVAEQLCTAFLAGSPDTPELRTAARQVADLALLLTTIQGAIHAELDRLAKDSTLEAQHDQWFQNLPTPEGLARGFSYDPESPDPGFKAFLPTPAELEEWQTRFTAEKAKPDVERRTARHAAALLNPSRTLKSLKTYDRKARSRLSKAILRLDYLTIEALRTQG